MATKNKYLRVKRWFVEPLDSSSNKALAEMLGADMEQNLLEYTDKDGARRKLYQVSFRDFAKLASSRFEEPWQFEWWIENSHHNITQFEIPIDDPELMPPV